MNASLLPPEDGYQLWLRYQRIADAARLAKYRAAIAQMLFRADAPVLLKAREELTRGLDILERALSTR